MYRKKWLILFFVCIWSLSKAQIPVLQSNTFEKEKTKSLIYNNLFGKYDFVISCARQSYWWADRQFYEILVYRDGRWEKLYITSRKKKNGKWTNPKLKIKPFNSDSANRIIKAFNKNDFWHLSNDSLNIHRKLIDDSTFQSFQISDGVNYEFEIMNRKDYLIIRSYEPEFYFKKIPEIKSREAFIKCKDVFLSVYAEK